MEKFEFSSTRELKPRTDNYFTRDTIGDEDTVALSQTDVIWSMSQNVIPQDTTSINEAYQMPFYPLLLSIIACMAIKNPVGAIQTLSIYAEEKLQHIRDTIPHSTRSGIISTSFPAVAFPTSSVMFIHTIKSTTPDTPAPQS